MNSFLHKVFLGLDLTILLQVVYYYPKLPETMASHFDGSGQPNAFAAKTSQVAIIAIITILTNVIWLGIPKMLENLKLTMINLPNKDYWFAPERRAATIADLKTRFYLFGIASLIFMLIVNQLLINANLSKDHRLPTEIILPLLVIYFVGILFWIGSMLFKYMRRNENR